MFGIIILNYFISGWFSLSHIAAKWKLTRQEASSKLAFVESIEYICKK